MREVQAGVDRGGDVDRVLHAEHVPVPGADEFLPSINLTVAAGDGMHSGDDGYYLKTGASALHLIHDAISAGGVSRDAPRRILDYACGYGRVLRWLEAAFPRASIAAADTDDRALDAVRSLFRADTHRLDGSMTEDLGTSFDLIWVGSLATHLPRNHWQALLRRFHGMLGETGILVFTTHGPYVAGRLRSREKVYELDEPGVELVLRGYERDGFGFSPYTGETAYGISISRPSVSLADVEAAGLQPLLYRSRGWVRHQDALAAVRP